MILSMIIVMVMIIIYNLSEYVNKKSVWEGIWAALVGAWEIPVSNL